uniref:Uncharacterized protein n=1 Tax=Panagrellus redivivus TaxID=6233 RepID=A0A7E4VU25_PANRE
MPPSLTHFFLQPPDERETRSDAMHVLASEPVDPIFTFAHKRLRRSAPQNKAQTCFRGVVVKPASQERLYLSYPIAPASAVRKIHGAVALRRLTRLCVPRGIWGCSIGRWWSSSVERRSLGFGGAFSLSLWIRLSIYSSIQSFLCLTQSYL